MAETETAPITLTVAELHRQHKERQARIKAASVERPPAPPAPIRIPSNSFDIISTELAAYFKVRVQDLISHRRIGFISASRHMLIYMMYRLTNYTSSQIGDRLDRDRSTITYAIKKIQNNLPLHRKEIEELEARIRPLLQQKRT